MASARCSNGITLVPGFVACWRNLMSFLVVAEAELSSFGLQRSKTLFLRVPLAKIVEIFRCQELM